MAIDYGLEALKRYKPMQAKPLSPTPVQGPNIWPMKPAGFRDTTYSQPPAPAGSRGMTIEGEGLSPAIDGLQDAMPGSIQASQPSASPSASWQRTPGGTGTSGTDWASAQGTDPRISGRADVESLVRDMGRNLDMEKKLQGQPGNYMSGATPTDINYFQSLLSGSPDFGDEATARDQKTRDSYDTAVSEGFRGGQDYDPVAKRAEYGRQAETEKMNIPLKQQEISEAGELEKQQEVSRGNLDVAKTKAEQDATFFDRLAQMQAGGTDVSRLSSGGRSVSFGNEQRAPQALLRDVTAAQQAISEATAALQGTLSTAETSPELEAAYGTLDAALGKVFGQDPAPIEMQEMAIDIIQDPELAGLDLDSAITHPNLVNKYDEISLTPQEREHLFRLLNYGRGI